MYNKTVVDKNTTIAVKNEELKKVDKYIRTTNLHETLEKKKKSNKESP